MSYVLRRLVLTVPVLVGITMLNSGKTYLEQYPHLTIFPGGCIMLAVFGFNFLGDGLRDLIDPRLRRGR